jgi:subfamily B ATP-binding cassette protein MsbA
LRDITKQLAEDSIKVNVNRTVVNNVYQFSMAVFIFVLIYLAITVTSLSFGALGVFLFALFRLASKLSLLQDQIYGAESDIPHLLAPSD